MPRSRRPASSARAAARAAVRRSTLPAPSDVEFPVLLAEALIGTVFGRPAALELRAADDRAGATCVAVYREDGSSWRFAWITFADTAAAAADYTAEIGEPTRAAQLSAA